MRFNRNIIKEGKLVTVKRQYTDLHPKRTVQVITPVRNKILSFVDENKGVTRTQLSEFLKGLNEETGRNTSMKWIRHNSNLFKRTNENGVIYYRLSSLGRTVLSKTMMNENYYYQLNKGSLISLKLKTNGDSNRRFALLTPVRQKVLNFLGENEKIAKNELSTFFKSYNEESGRNTTMRWFKSNAYLFNTIKENDETYFTISRIGSKVLEKTKISETVFVDDIINEEYSDMLIKSIAKRCEVDLTQLDMKQIKIGMSVELKHGSKLGGFADITNDDPEMTFRIVLANLMTNSKYYTEAKPENWGELEIDVEPLTYSSTGMTNDTDETPDDDEYFEPEEFDNDGEETVDDEDGEETDDDETDDNDDDETDDDNDEEADANLSDENKAKIIEFLNKRAEGKMSDDDKSKEFEVLAKEVGFTTEGLEKCIFKNAVKGAERSDVELTVKDLDADTIAKIKDAILKSAGDMGNDFFDNLTSELKIDSKEKIKDVMYQLAISELKRKKMTHSNLESAYESGAPAINNNAGQGKRHLGKIVAMSTPQINTTDGDNKVVKPESMFVGMGNDRSRFATRKIMSIEAFINNRLHESLELIAEAGEPRIGKKFDKIVSEYKALLSKREKIMKDFVVAFKAETDTAKKEIMKTNHMANYKQLDKEIAEMEKTYNAAVKNLDVSYDDDDE